MSDCDRETWTLILSCAQCGHSLAAPACGFTHALLAEDPTQHRHYPRQESAA
jgi:hypothetical protein